MARFNKMKVKKLYLGSAPVKSGEQNTRTTLVTATADELNILDGVSATAESLSGGRVRVEVTTTSTLTDQQVRNTIITNYGMATGGDTTLPAYSGSITCTIITEAASKSWSFKPPSGEAFVLDGTALDADDEVDVGQVVGDMAQLVRIRTGESSYKWHYLTSVGTHSDGGAS